MKIFISTSTSFYDRITAIKEQIEKQGHEVILPCSYENPNAEEEAWEEGHEVHGQVVREFFRQSEEKVKSADVVLCLNYDKEKDEKIYQNYIGGAVYTELYEAFKNEKIIFLYHDIPVGILYDEIAGFNPIVINENLGMMFCVLKLFETYEKTNYNPAEMRINQRLSDEIKRCLNETLQKYQEQSSNASTEKQCELKQLSFCTCSEPVAVKEAHPGFDEPSDSYKRYVEYSKDCSAGGRVRAAERRTIGPSTSNK